MCEELKQCPNIKQFKVKYKEHVFTKYRDEIQYDCEKTLGNRGCWYYY